MESRVRTPVGIEGGALELVAEISELCRILIYFVELILQSSVV